MRKNRRGNNGCDKDKQVLKANDKLLAELQASYSMAKNQPRDCRHCARNHQDIDSLVCGKCGPELQYYMPRTTPRRRATV